MNLIFHSPLFKASSSYTIFSLLNSGIPFLLLPILTRYLSPDDYGIVAMFSILVSIIGCFTGLSVHGAINRVYFEKNINFEEYIANCLAILFSSFLFCLFLIFPFKGLISQFSGVPDVWVIIAVIVSFFNFLILSYLTIFQAQLRAKEYGFFQISQSIVNVFLSIVLVVYFSLKWEGRLLAQLIAVISFGLISFFHIYRKWVKWRIDRYYIKHALKFGIPLIPHTLGGLLMVITDRFIITNMLGLKQAGIYTAGLQIGSIINLFADAFNRAYAPWLFEKLNQNDEKVKLKIVKFTYIYFTAILLFSMLLGISAPLIVKLLLGREFHTSYKVVLFIALGGAFNGMYYMVTNYIFYVYKTYILTWITFFIGILNIPLTIVLTEKNGIVGAGQSYAILLGIFFLMTWFLASKVYEMPWNLRSKEY